MYEGQSENVWVWGTREQSRNHFTVSRHIIVKSLPIQLHSVPAMDTAVPARGTYRHQPSKLYTKCVWWLFSPKVLLSWCIQAQLQKLWPRFQHANASWNLSHRYRAAEHVCISSKELALKDDRACFFLNLTTEERVNILRLPLVPTFCPYNITLH